jgi:RNA binding exosome subunit
LSSNIPVAYVNIRIFAHATEDLDRVITAFHNILPSEFVDTLVYKKTALTGHHGNIITLLEARIKNRKFAQAFLEKLASSLSMMDKETLSNEIDRHLENGNLFVRLDKQASYRGSLKFGSTDSIHVKMHFRKSRREDVIEICRRFGLLP